MHASKLIKASTMPNHFVTKPTIFLLVDEHRQMVDFLRTRLSEEYNIVIAHTSEEIISLLKSQILKKRRKAAYSVKRFY
jgi:hypothetical protein